MVLVFGNGHVASSMWKVIGKGFFVTYLLIVISYFINYQLLNIFCVLNVAESDWKMFFERLC